MDGCASFSIWLLNVSRSPNSGLSLDTFYLDSRLIIYHLSWYIFWFVGHCQMWPRATKGLAPKQSAPCLHLVCCLLDRRADPAPARACCLSVSWESAESRLPLNYNLSSLPVLFWALDLEVALVPSNWTYLYIRSWCWGYSVRILISPSTVNFNC